MSAPEQWCVVANVADPRSTKLRMGSKVAVLEMNSGNGSDRVRVRGLSIGGRPITVWIGARYLRNARAAWSYPDEDGEHEGETWGAKADAAKAAERVNYWAGKTRRQYAGSTAAARATSR